MSCHLVTPAMEPASELSSEYTGRKLGQGFHETLRGTSVDEMSVIICPVCRRIGFGAWLI